MKATSNNTVNLDLSGLFTISKNNSLLEPFYEEKPTAYMPKSKNRSQRRSEPPEAYSKIIREYSENVRKSEQLRSEILKELSAGKDPAILFLKAAEALSLMTGDQAFYAQIKGDMLAIYGEALQEKGCLIITKQEAEQRLEKLQEAQKQARDQEAYLRINRAIRSHKYRIEGLEELIKSEEKKL